MTDWFLGWAFFYIYVSEQICTKMAVEQMLGEQVMTKVIFCRGMRVLDKQTNGEQLNSAALLSSSYH